MQKVDFHDAVELVLERDSRYAADAYHFLQKALAETVKELQGKELEGDRHVSGGEAVLKALVSLPFFPRFSADPASNSHQRTPGSI